MAYVDPAYHGGKNVPEQVADEKLTCAICKEPGFKRPKLLACGHTFCLPCLQGHFGIVGPGGCVPHCVTCGKPIQVDDMNKLKDDLLVDTQVDRLVRCHNKERGRDDTHYNISKYSMDGKGHVELNQK